MKSYISLWMEFEGLIIFWFVCVNNVYGCMYCMCLSGGFCSIAICSSSVVVQLGVSACDIRVLHVSRIGLMVVMSANNILGGGWCRFWCI